MVHWLTRRRNELALKQADIARHFQTRGISLDPSAVSHWEHGRAQPPLRDPMFRHVLAEVLQVSVRDLLTLAGYEVDNTLNEQTLTIAERVSLLTSEQQQVMLSILDMLQGSQKTAQVNVELRFSVGDESAVFTLPLRSSKK